MAVRSEIVLPSNPFKRKVLRLSVQGGYVLLRETAPFHTITRVKGLAMNKKLTDALQPLLNASI